jgi:colanic acid/amylovoran biosynthesis protein
LEGIPKNVSLIGISIGYGAFKRGIGKRKNLIDAKNNLSKVIAEFVDYAQEKYNVDILLIPHVLIPGENDKEVLTNIASNVKRTERVHIVKGEYTPSELKGLIGSCTLLVSSRFHPVIHAVSMGVVPITIAYSHKMPSFMTQLGISRYCLSIEDLTLKKLIYWFENAWENRLKISSELIFKSKEMKSLAMVNFDLIKSLFITKVK